MTLLENTLAGVRDRERWLDEMRQAAKLVGELPKELQELDGTADVTGGILILNFYGKEALMLLVGQGAVFEKAKLSSCNKKFWSIRTWYLKGRLGAHNIWVTNLGYEVIKEYEAIRYKTDRKGVT